MSMAVRCFPAASVLVLAVLAVLPWELPSAARLMPPFLPLAAIYFWSSRPSARLSDWVPFIAGLLVDVLLDGPLGFWPLIYLTGGLLGAEGRTAAHRPGSQWTMFAISTGTLALAAWGVASFYNFALVDWRPFAWGACFTGLSYPLLAYVLRVLDPEPLRPSNDRLIRGA
jgi:rod shape-determining protein MreD